MNLSLTTADYAHIKQNFPHSFAAKYISASAEGKPMPWIDKRIALIAYEILINAVFIPVYAILSLRTYFTNKIRRCFIKRPIENHMVAKLETSLRTIKLCLYIYFRARKTAAEFKKFEEDNKPLTEHNKFQPFFKKLPKDIQNHVLHYLDNVSLEKLPTICRGFKELLDTTETIAIRLANVENKSEFKAENLELLLALTTKAGDKVKELNPGPNLEIDGKMLAQIIKNCPNIEKLTFYANERKFKPEDWALFKDLKHLKYLKILLRWNITQECIEHLSRCTQLTHLELGDRHVTISPFRTSEGGYKPLSKLTNLEHLSVSGMVDFYDGDLKEISGLKKLRHLDVSWCPITDQGLSYIGNMTQLRHLFVDNCTNLTHVGFSHLMGMLQLESLSASECNMTNAGLSHLCNLSQLSYLNLSQCDLKTGGLKPLQNFTKIKHLDLSYNNIENSEWDHLKFMKISDWDHLINIKYLEHLNLKNCGLYGGMYGGMKDGLAKAAEIGFPKLKYLNLEGGEYNDDDLIHLKSFPLLEELYLNSAKNITSKGLKFIGYLKFLKSLDLAYSQLDDESLSELKNLSLEFLDLSSCKKITDEGLKYIGQIKSLKTLDLGSCDLITDVGLTYLYPLVNLKELHLPWPHRPHFESEPNISNKAVKALMEKFQPWPRLDVYPKLYMDFFPFG